MIYCVWTHCFQEVILKKNLTSSSGFKWTCYVQPNYMVTIMLKLHNIQEIPIDIIDIL